MTKYELLSELKKEISEEEQRLLNADEGLSINDFNRGVMLEMLGLDEDGPALRSEADAAEADEARSSVHAYLEQYYAENPPAWKWIELACVYLSFVAGRPMHPPERAEVRIETAPDGSITYYCKYKEPGEGSTCNFCVCEKEETPGN